LLVVVCERGVTGPREIECAILGGDHPRVSVPGEIQVEHADGFYSYKAKYVDEVGVGLHIPAALTPEQTSAVQALSLAVYEALEAEGLARVDLFLARDGSLYVNEINTMPGFTSISMFPRLWQASGVAPRELMDRLIEDALARGARRRARRSTP
jgi:D-alanine-D-alanine ligase